ncbi:MAG: hypothetical protein CR985_03530 [Flavobacteriales bacterium]|nr:MAG: hypothetical protein CR985_03530 [Flavobacteriales bacterium]
MKKILLTITLFTLLTGCQVKPEPIDYGKDACHYCKMNIVDKTHSAEIVTKKGKAFKYDAIECMINDLKKRENSEVALFLVADYGKPGVLIDATKATFLISPAIKSPMGANLSAFSKKDEAEKYVKTKDDKIYTWNEIQQQEFKDFK